MIRMVTMSVQIINATSQTQLLTCERWNRTLIRYTLYFHLLDVACSCWCFKALSVRATGVQVVEGLVHQQYEASRRSGSGEVGVASFL